MYKNLTLSLFCSLLIACDSKTDNIQIDSNSLELGSAVASPSYAVVSFTESIQYEWSVRAVTPLGNGAWSTGLEFSIHETEAHALADAIAEIDSIDYNPSLYSDALPVPTVVPVGPAGSLVGSDPTFEWGAVVDAETYEVRIISVETNETIFSDAFVAEDICSNEGCELPSAETVPEQAPELAGATIPTVDSNAQPTKPDSSPIVVAENSEQTTSEVEKPEPVIPDVVVPVEVTPEQVTPEQVTPEQVTPEQVTPEQVTPEQVTPEQVTPEQVTPEQVTPEQVTPEQETPEQVTPEQVTPEQETPEQVTPEQETPEQELLQVDGGAVNAEIESLQSSEGVLAFPGALGYGRQSVGGRSGRVIVVDTVTDVVDSNDGKMSLREAIEVEDGPRTIVFAVGGIFDTGSRGMDFTGEGGSNVTVACQSAPAPGVIIKTYGFNVQNGAHDLVFRHCAVRIVDVGAPASQSARTFTIRGGSRDIILDHMSFSWATDEGFQVYLDANQQTGLENITLSNSIVAEGDADSSHHLSASHPDWGYHAMGPSCNNNNTHGFRPTNCSIVNNFIAHNSSRNAMIWGGAGELVNNIIYNWYGIGLTAQPFSGEDVDAIVSNNLMKSGPDTIGGTFNQNCGPAEYRCAMYLGKSDHHGSARYAVGENFYIPEYKTLSDAVLIDHWNADTPAGEPTFDGVTPSPENIKTMATPGSRHLACVGASRPVRDAVDARVIQEFHDGTGAIGIGDNVRTGGHNVNTQRTWGIYGAPTAHAADYDTDKDGMPDSWELEYGLNPQDPNDHSGDLDGDGYTNIEEFLAIAASC